MNKLCYSDDEFRAIIDGADCQCVETSQYMYLTERTFVFFHETLKQHYMFQTHQYHDNPSEIKFVDWVAYACEPVEIRRIEWRMKRDC